MSVSVSMWIYIASHYRAVPLMRPMRRILPKQVRIPIRYPRKNCGNPRGIPITSGLPTESQKSSTRTVYRTPKFFRWKHISAVCYVGLDTYVYLVCSVQYCHTVSVWCIRIIIQKKTMVIHHSPMHTHTIFIPMGIPMGIPVPTAALHLVHLIYESMPTWLKSKEFRLDFFFSHLYVCFCLYIYLSLIHIWRCRRRG